MPSRSDTAITRPPVEPLSLSIVLPCFNEEGNLRRVVEQALQVGRRLARNLEIVIVNDGSGDRTGAVADELARQHHEVRVIHHQRNEGYGAAVARGLQAARCDWVFYSDGDGQFDLAQIADLLPLMREDDVVAGHRLDRKDRLTRRIAGWLWTKLINLTFGLRVRDVDCAFKVFPRSFLQQIELVSRGALISPELLVRAQQRGLSVTSIGVRHLPRVAGQSTGGSLRVIGRAFRELVLLRREILRRGPTVSALRHPHPSPLPRLSVDSGRSLSAEGEGVRFRAFWPCLAIFAVAIVVFLPSLWNHFTGWDDTAYTVDNPHMQTLAGLRQIWTSKENEQYYPLTFTMMWVEYQMFGDRPLGYHAVSVLLHALNAAILVMVLRNMGLRDWPAMLAAALFAVHPVQVMSVAWIAEQKNLLACLFVELCMLAWLRPRAARWHLIALLCYAAALLSKSAVVGLPVALMVIDRFMLGRTIGATLRRAIPMFAVAGGSIVLTMIFEQKFIQRADALGIPDLLERLLLAVAAPWWYLKQLLWPIDLSPFYPLWNLAISNWKLWLAIAAWLAVGVVIMRMLRRPSSPWRGSLLWSLAHYVVMLAPTLGIIPFGNMHATHVSDHFLYVACIGPFALVGLCVHRLTEHLGHRRHVGLGIVSLATVCILAVMAVRDIPIYRDAKSLWSHAIRRAPNNAVAHLGLGVALRNESRSEDALALFIKSAALQPDLEDAHVFAAQIQLARGDLTAAERTVHNALATNAQSERLTDLLAQVFERGGKAREAVPVLEQLVAMDPDNAERHVRLGQMYFAIGRTDDAERECAEAIRLKPDHGFAYIGLATCFKARGEWGRGAEILGQGLFYAPNDVPLQNMLALFYAAAPEPAVRRGTEALEIAQRLLEQLSGVEPVLRHPVMDTLAAAYAEIGQFDDAVRNAEEAAALARQAGNTAAAQESLRRAELYRQRQPWRMR